jgi:hypothetical protein
VEATDNACPGQLKAGRGQSLHSQGQPEKEKNHVSRVKSRLTYANVTATIALFLALGGGAFAAIHLPKKSVGTKQLKAKAVTNPKLGDKAVTSDKLADGAVTAAKVQGGLPFFRNVVAREVVAPGLATNNSEVEDIQCASGEVAVGGGASGTIVGTRNFPNLDVDTQVLADGPIDANDRAAANGATATGWHISAKVLSGPRDLHLYALCAQK